MKKNNKAFILTEVIVVSAVVIGALIIIYTQFINIINSYNSSFKYNSVEDLYLLDNISNFIKKDGFEQLTLQLETNNYLDITNCETIYFTEFHHCKALVNNLKIKTLLFTNEDITSLKNNVGGTIYSESLKKFIRWIKPKKEINVYRIVAEFEDGTFATLKNLKTDYIGKNITKID